MPVYDYMCHDCNASFEVILTLKEHETEEITCPKCDSNKVEQEAVEFYAVTSRKS